MSFDAIVIGSGFGGAITVCRLSEAGLKVLVLERGRRWDNKPGPGVSVYPSMSDSPGSWVWDHAEPELLNGWLDLRVFNGMSVAQCAGVGGGSLIYANISVEAPDPVFQSGWPAEFRNRELKPYYDRVASFMDVRPLPKNQWNPRIHLMQEGAAAIGAPNRFQQIDLAVNFDDNLVLDPANPPTAKDTIYKPNKHGAMQGTCIHAGDCDTGCPVKAKNTLDLNYLWVAENKHHAEVRPLHLVRYIEPSGTGYRVHFNQIKDGGLVPGSEEAGIVVVAAGSLGSTEIMFRCRDEYKTLPAISNRLGRNWSSNGDFLVPSFYEHRELYPEVGPTINSAINFLDRSRNGQSFWIEDGGFPVLFGRHMEIVKSRGGFHPYQALVEWLQKELKTLNPLEKIMPWFAQGVDAGDGEFCLKRPWYFFGEKRFNLKWDITHSLGVFNAILETHEELTHKTGGVPLVNPFWKEMLVTPHPLGGCNIGNTANEGVVDHTGQVFGYENLYVVDAAIIPTPLGVNPSRTIGALAERCAEMIVQKGRRARAAAR
ncbi:MAG TPA: GMC family oxidoreductase [Candidatus Angelobacter sp.]|nr:GMC family oxidoreductase [Candidatus Angelobacter sp.]